MSFGGSVSAMITSIKNNARQRKSLFDKVDYYRNRNSGDLKNKPGRKATPEQLKIARIQITTENRIVNIKRILALIISVLIMILLTELLFDFF